MRYASIKDFDIQQGDGVNVSLWTQGCPHHCKGCYNPHTWDLNGGYPFTDKEYNTIINLLTDGKIHKNLSILGGEPLMPQNLNILTKLCKDIKRINPNIKIFVWTGYTYVNVKNLELMKYIDVLVDGKYIINQHETTRYKGSKNQRVINVPLSIKQDNVILYR